MKASLNTKIDFINRIEPSVTLSGQQLTEIYTISNLIKNIPELATNSLNDIISNIAYQQVQSIFKRTLFLNSLILATS